MFILVLLFSQFACASKIEQLKFDSRGKVLTFNIGKQDTIFFQENSSEIDSIYSESLSGIVNFVKLNNHKVFLRANTHEEEKSTITSERINAVENYFLNAGFMKEQVLKNYRIQIVPISEDTILTEDEKKPVRRVIIQIVK